MSVTVREVLQLPSLRNATVIAGQGGLNKIVSGITVLEAAHLDKFEPEFFRSGDFLASELVITGFLNNTQDVDLQCNIIRKLAEQGEVGLILFYVGIYMPVVDKRLIKVADELDFALIRMPDNKYLRYAEVISDVSEYIYRDREENTSIVLEVLDRITGLNEQYRSVNTVLQMLSERLQAIVVLTDKAFNVLNMATWPRGMEEDVKELQDIFLKSSFSEETISYPHVTEGYISHSLITPVSSPALHLYLIKEGSRLSSQQQEQAADVVRIGVNIWGQKHSTIVISELIRSILQDDPFTMRRLADIFHVNIQEIHDVWIFYGENQESREILQKYQNDLVDVLKSCAGNVFSDFYDDRLFLFSSDPYSLKTVQNRLGEVLIEMKRETSGITMFSSGNLQTTSEVRRAYLCYKNHLQDVRLIYPSKSWFSLGELEFSQVCHQLIDQGEDAVHQTISRIQQLQEKNNDWDIIHTLEVFLLDTECSITRSAKILNVHQNTIKYRINTISNSLGFRPGKMPDSIGIYRALAVNRLIHHDVK